MTDNKKHYYKHLKFDKFSKQVSVSLSEKCFEALDKLYFEFGIPKSFVIRQALEKYLRNEGLVND